MSKISSICVYCGTGEKVDQAYKDAAKVLGTHLAKQGIRLVYGGGRVGLMGIVADAAYENGGEVIGIIPEHIQEKETLNTDVTELHVVDSMHTRKRMMMERSDAFVVLPGGFGTLDETFEILTWKYLRLHDKPVAFLNVKDFWSPLLDMVDHMVVAGFTPKWHKDMFLLVDNAEDAVSALKNRKGHLTPDLEKL